MVALITGASAGLGRALAREFAARGYSLILLARRSDLLAALQEEIQKEFAVRVWIRSVDACDEQAMIAAARDGSAELGDIQIAVANAGFGVSGAIAALPTAKLREQFELNVFGVVHTLRAALPSLTRTRGCFCIIGSASAYLTFAGTTAYSMSKFAVRSLADGLRQELASSGIAVTLINPGFIQTDIRKSDGVADPVPLWIQMPAETAARQIARAVIARKRERAVTWHARLGIFIARFFPDLLAWIGERGHKSRPASTP